MSNCSLRKAGASVGWNTVGSAPTTQLDLYMYRLIPSISMSSRFLGSWPHSVQVSSLLPIEATFKGLQTCKSIRSDQVWWQPKMKSIWNSMPRNFQQLFFCLTTAYKCWICSLISHCNDVIHPGLKEWRPGFNSHHAWPGATQRQRHAIINVQCALPGRSCTCHFCGKMRTVWQCDVSMEW